jgi:hypothetical protein
VSGPPNRAKHGIAPLTGVVETDWSPFTFTMNWRFTAPGEVTFEKDEPFCFFFPIARALLPATEPEYRLVTEDGELEREFKAWSKARDDFNRDLQVADSQAVKDGWQRTYFQGMTPSGKLAPPDHRTRQRVRPFKPLG